MSGGPRVVNYRIGAKLCSFRHQIRGSAGSGGQTSMDDVTRGCDDGKVDYKM